MNSLKTQYPRISFFSPIASVLCLVTQTFQMYKRNLEKVEEPEIKLTTSVGLSKKQENFRKISTSVLLTMLKSLTMWVTKIGTPNHLTYLLRNWYAGQKAAVKTRHGTMDWFKLGKEYVKAVYCHPAYLTSMQSTS